MKLLMVSLGCDKNLVDSEEMLGILTSRGFEITDDETEAEAAVINTCCFIEDAKKELVDDAKVGEGYLNSLSVYEKFAREYVKQGHTWIEAFELACDDMRRIDPELYDEEYLKKLIEDARIG